MSCLTYLLQMFSQGHRFLIFYDGNHCCGINEKKLFDLNGTFKKDVLLGGVFRYERIEKCHEKEQIKRIFNLDEKNSKILDEYFVYLKNV
jgi:hypothetical protein